MSETLIERWKRIMGVHPQDFYWAAPEPPATRRDIEIAESALGMSLPSLLKELMLCSRAWQWREQTYDAVLLLPPERIVHETLEPVAEISRIVVGESRTTEVKAYFYSRHRLTFAYSDYHRFQIDSDPGPGGHINQIVVIDHDEQTIDVAAKSLDQFIMHGLDCLERQLKGGYPHDA